MNPEDKDQLLRIISRNGLSRVLTTISNHVGEGAEKSAVSFPAQHRILLEAQNDIDEAIIKLKTL